MTSQKKKINSVISTKAHDQVKSFSGINPITQKAISDTEKKIRLKAYENVDQLWDVLELN